MKERESFGKYCRLALAIRGMWWAVFMYAGLVVFGLIDWWVLLFAIAVYGVGFPIACEIGRRFDRVKFVNKLVHVEGAWEVQEVVYGLFHTIVNVVVVYEILM